MASKGHLSFAARAAQHKNTLVKQLFSIAESKKSNLVVSADLTTTAELLALAEDLGPYIVVLKTHIDIVEDFGPATVEGLIALSKKHDFLLFEDRKFIDIGSTVQMQYRGGALRIHEWAHIINASVLAGDGIIQALEETMEEAETPDRGILILAEMSSKGSLATGKYTEASVKIAQKYPNSVIGFISTRELSSFCAAGKNHHEDFVVFTTGVSISSDGDALGQQYQTPDMAIAGGSDLLIVGRGIYATQDPVAAAKVYQQLGWEAYLRRTVRR